MIRYGTTSTRPKLSFGGSGAIVVGMSVIDRFPDTCAAFETIRGAAGRSLFENPARNRDRAVCLRTRFGRFTLAGYASDVKTTPSLKAEASRFTRKC